MLRKPESLAEFSTYICNDSVTTVLGNKVLDLAGRRILQATTSNEVVRDPELFCVRSLAIDVGHRPPIGVVGDTIYDLSHGWFFVRRKRIRYRRKGGEWRRKIGGVEEEEDGYMEEREREKFGGEVGDLNLVLYRREAQALEAQGVMNRVQM